MDAEMTLHRWFGDSEPFIRSLADAARTEIELSVGARRGGGATGTVAAALSSLQKRMSTNPCPDRMIGDQLQLVLARYGFVALVLGSGVGELDGEQIGALGVRLQELNMDLLTLLTTAVRGLGEPCG
ncbi:MAG: hypothetical protein ACRDYE_10140 [Acidimicrobiales bacterium]